MRADHGRYCKVAYKANKRNRIIDMEDCGQRYVPQSFFAEERFFFYLGEGRESGCEKSGCGRCCGLLIIYEIKLKV